MMTNNTVKKPDYVLFDKQSRAFIYNMQTNAVQRMLDFDYASKRETPSVAAIINPTGSDGYTKFFFGPREVLIPVYKSMETATNNQPDADVLINFASYRSAASATMEALQYPSIRTVVIIAEGIPERQIREVIARANELDKVIIGPATVGGIVAGQFKVGNTGGTIENILEAKLHRPGSVGFVSKSGGLSNETYNIVAMNTDGLYEGIAIGGDRYPGSTMLDNLLRFEKNPDIKMLVALGEVGGTDEFAIVEALKTKKITKPLVIWVTGTCAKAFTAEVQFGHAGAKADAEMEQADSKNKALRDAGAFVPNSFDDYDKLISEVYNDLVKQGVITPAPEPEMPNMPVDFKVALQEGMIRKPTNFICTISDDRGEECLYGNKTISQVAQEGLGIGGTISLLWFKRLMPKYALDFIEMCMVITADHGPAVSGAHNCIVASRAGKDLISSVVSGLLTIGPRFGGAIDGAAQMFSAAYDEGKSPAQFISDLKKSGVNIQGIGHLIKSTHNPDKRVTLLRDFALNNFKETPILNFALEVEKLTTAKRDNLILNVDGCIGISFVDLLRNEMPKEEADEYINMGALNGLFVLGRSIGLIGHHLDQKRLKQGLYRHPWDDIAFLESE